MKKLLLSTLLASTLLFTSCGTTYRVASSTSAIQARTSVVGTHVAVAKTSSNEARMRAASAEAETVAARRANVGTTANIDSALGALKEKSYTSAAEFLVAAKVSNVVVMSYLDQVLKDLVSAKQNFESVSVELNDAETEIDGLKLETTKLQSAINKQTVDGASDSEVARRCRSWFGLGAIFYGVEHLLKAGILGILILGGVVIALVIAGYFIGGPFGSIVLKLAGKGIGFVFKRKS